MATNHPAHGPVSLERLHQIREHLQHDTQYSNGGNRAYILADVLKVIDGAIAAFGAEPIGEVIEQQSGVMMDGLVISEKPTYRNIKGIHKMKMMPLGTKFYTVPPAPVDIDRLQESAYKAGLTAGWNFGIERNSAGFDKCLTAHQYNPNCDAMPQLSGNTERLDQAPVKQPASNEPVSDAYKLPAVQIKPVADLYEMQFDDGHTCAFHTDHEKAIQWLTTCDGNKVQEYVKLERYQEAMVGNSPVTLDGSACKYCGGTGYFRWQQSENMYPCPCKGCTELAAPHLGGKDD